MLMPIVNRARVSAVAKHCGFPAEPDVINGLHYYEEVCLHRKQPELTWAGA